MKPGHVLPLILSFKPNMEAKRKMFTLVLVQKQSQILLGLKKRGFGVGLWNGFGGKVEIGETIVEGAIRELREESGIRATEQTLHKCGYMEMDFVDGSEPLEIHVFRCSSFQDDPIETDEMKPQWFDVGHIPYSQMWNEAAIWFPAFLRGSHFRAHFLFDNKFDIISHRMLCEKPNIQ